jgi:nitrate reductase NapA
MLGSVAGANVLGAAAWGGLELLVKTSGQPTWHKSVCRFCGTGCGIQVAMDEGRIVDVRGDELAHNKGVICVKGSMVRALPYVGGRLTAPKIRRNGRLVGASWDEAMGLAAETFKRVIAESGKDAVAFYGSGQLFTEESYTANKLFKAGIGTNNVDGNPRLCMASAASGYTQVFGKDEPPGSYEDVDHATFFFLIGANPFECHPPIFERIRRRKAQNPEVRIVCVDPRRTLTAERSDLHLQPVPGTDLLLLNAMAQVICEEGLHDRAFIEKHVRFSDGTDSVGFADFKAFLDHRYKPEAVEKELGIPAYQIREVAFSFARARAAMSLWTMGFNQRTQGTFLNNLMSGLHLITGQICRPGATPFSLTGQPNACGGVRDTGALAHTLPNGRLVANEKHRAEMEEIWGVPVGTISPKPGHDAVSLFRAMEDGRVKAGLVMCTNPAQSMPAADRYRAAMEKCFLVVAEAFGDSETAQLADVLLPAALWVEKEGVLGQGERRYQLVEKLLDAPGQARSDLQILVDFADRLGHAGLIKARSAEAVWDEWRQVSARSLYNFKGITRARLRKERGLQWPCPDESHPGTVRRYVEGDDPFVTNGAGIEFYGQHDKRAVVFLRPYLPSPEMPTKQYPFQLTTGRVLEQWHTGTMTQRIDELKAAAGDARIELHEQDAFRLGIDEGDEVELKSRYGSLRGRARLSRSPRPGVVFASFYDTKLLINRVVADTVDPTSKEPEYKVTAVSVAKARA